MDALSQILSTVQLEGSLYFPALFHGQWGLDVPENTSVCRFHVVVEGHCLLRAHNQEIQLRQGDLALVPHGRQHTLQDAPQTPLIHLEEALGREQYSGTGVFEWGEGGPPSRLVCGHFAFDKEAVHPLVEALPALVHLQATPTYDFRWVDQVMRFMGEEMHAQKPGSQLIAQRLSEILFVQVVRHYGEMGTTPIPVLTALVDPRLSRALFAMHGALDQQWTLLELSTQAAMSRTAFAERFTELVGSTPMKYLQSQRMNLAGKLLRNGGRSAEIAGRVGYRSEAAFARVFKKTYRIGPGEYRRNHDRRQEDLAREMAQSTGR